MQDLTRLGADPREADLPRPRCARARAARWPAASRKRVEDGAAAPWRRLRAVEKAIRPILRCHTLRPRLPQAASCKWRHPACCELLDRGRKAHGAGRQRLTTSQDRVGQRPPRAGACVSSEGTKFEPTCHSRCRDSSAGTDSLPAATQMQPSLLKDHPSLPRQQLARS